MKGSRIHENIPKVQARIEIMVNLTKKEMAEILKKKDIQKQAVEACHLTYHNYKESVKSKKIRADINKEQELKVQLQDFISALVQSERQCARIKKVLFDLNDKSTFFTNSLNDAKAFNDNCELQKLINMSGVDTDMMSKVHDQQMEMEERLQISAQELADRQMASANLNTSSVSADSEVASRMEEMLKSHSLSEYSTTTSQQSLYSYIDLDTDVDADADIVVDSILYA